MNQPTLEYARLEGELVVIRPIRPADAAAVFPLIHGQRSVLDWLVWQGPETVYELSDIYAHWATPSDNGTNYHFALDEKSSGELCGTFALRFLDHPFVGDVGYWLGEHFWSRGIGTEANMLVAYLAFEHLGATALTAEVFVGNEASCRVLEKTGYRRERAVRTRPVQLEQSRADKTEWVYALTRSDFDRVRAGSGLTIPETFEVRLD
ncbi:MAG: GNAT family N-acetyltransferase [bacterium]|nr:GNAT family N-acetyltransferase [bacterium]